MTGTEGAGSGVGDEGGGDGAWARPRERGGEREHERERTGDVEGERVAGNSGLGLSLVALRCRSRSSALFSLFKSRRTRALNLFLYAIIPFRLASHTSFKSARRSAGCRPSRLRGRTWLTKEWFQQAVRVSVGVNSRLEPTTDEQGP